MRELRDLIQSPNALFVFEAAARHLSFTRAADELNVSQPAVSFAIKRLEESLGVRLFHRRHREIALTDVGERFYNDVSIGLTHILKSAERACFDQREDHVTLSTSTAFANYWVVPRLGDFRAKHPDIEIRVQTTDKDIDLAADRISLGVRRGAGDWPGYEASRLFAEEIFPIASPAFLAGRPAPGTVRDLMNFPLIHLDEPYRPRPTWTDWFRNAGVAYHDSAGGLRLNDYALVIQTAIAGEGVALGWRHIVEVPMRQGLLQQVLDHSLSGAAEFYAVWSSNAPLTDSAQAVLEWLKSQAGV